MDSLINLDLTGDDLLKKPEFVPVEPGVYTLEVANDCKIAPSKQSNNLVKLELVIIDGPEKGKKIYDNLVIADNCRWKIAQFLKACGLPRERVDVSTFKGAVCRAFVKQEMYTVLTGPDAGTQKPRNVIESYLFEEAASE